MTIASPAPTLVSVPLPVAPANTPVPPTTANVPFALNGSPWERGLSEESREDPGLQRAAARARSSVLPSLSSTMCSRAVTESQPAGTPGVKPVIARARVAAPNPSMRARPQSRLGGQVMLFLIPNEPCTFASKVAVCAAAGSANVSAASAAEMTIPGACLMNVSLLVVAALNARPDDQAAHRGRPWLAWSTG